MILIGLSGKAGAGKSTVARYLVEDYGFTLIKFADLIKDMLRVLGLTDLELEGAGKDKPCYLLGGKTPRLAMQTLGTEWGRHTMYSDIWVEAWYRRVNEVLQAGGKVVCDDVRFANEVSAVKQLSGAVIDIKNPSMVDHSDSHISETESLDHDFRILNNGTVTELREKISQYLRNRL
jgi:hypothetical protein